MSVAKKPMPHSALHTTLNMSRSQRAQLFNTLTKMHDAYHAARKANVGMSRLEIARELFHLACESGGWSAQAVMAGYKDWIAAGQPCDCGKCPDDYEMASAVQEATQPPDKSTN